MPELDFTLVEGDTFADIPHPARPGARCQSCDYWERLDGSRQAGDSQAARSLKLSRLLAGERLAGAYGMLAWRTDAAGDRVAVGWAQFGPISAYPRAQVIRDRYAELPDSPAPWVITCLQVVPDESDREGTARALLEATCTELDRRGIGAVEAYPEAAADAWQPSPGPAGVYRDGGFERAAGDDRYPVMRRELSEEAAEVGWGDLLSRTKPADQGDEWPLPLPEPPSDDDLFRLPERRKRRNPFGED